MINAMRKIASYFVSLSVIAFILTLVQPMSPQVDRMFRIGAGIVCVVCLVALFSLPARNESNSGSNSGEPGNE